MNDGASKSDRWNIYSEALRHFLGPVLAFLEDESVREIMINGPSEIFIERQGSLERTEARFGGEEDLLTAVRCIAQYVGRHMREDERRFDARLPAGHRVHVVLPPVSRGGISVTIRKHSRHKMGLSDLVERGTLSTEALAFLSRGVQERRNIIVSGGTGTGKTTLLNALSALIEPGERIIVIEDAAELQIQQEHVVSLETCAPDRKGRGAVSIRDLVHSALRMRPDRIIIGECRGGEALDLLQAMNTGHEGSMSTVHSNSPLDALRRLETLALMSGIDLPLRFLRAQVASAVHIVVQLQRLAGRRVIQSIAEISGLDAAEAYRVGEVFAWTVAEERLVKVSDPG